MRRVTARAVMRADQLTEKVDALGADLLAETVRGVSVHPYVGHEREARTELRLQWQALVKDATERRGKKKAPAGSSSGIAATLGAPARRLEVVS